MTAAYVKDDKVGCKGWGGPNSKTDECFCKDDLCNAAPSIGWGILHLVCLVTAMVLTGLYVNVGLTV